MIFEVWRQGDTASGTYRVRVLLNGEVMKGVGCGNDGCELTSFVKRVKKDMVPENLVDECNRVD